MAQEIELNEQLNDFSETFLNELIEIDKGQLLNDTILDNALDNLIPYSADLSDNISLSEIFKSPKKVASNKQVALSKEVFARSTCKAKFCEQSDTSCKRKLKNQRKKKNQKEKKRRDKMNALFNELQSILVGDKDDRPMKKSQILDYAIKYIKKTSAQIEKLKNESYLKI